MNKQLREEDFNDILIKFNEVIEKKVRIAVKNRDSIVCEILYQAFLELKRRVKAGFDRDPLEYLEKKYHYLYKRANHSFYKGESLLPSGKIAISFDDYTNGLEDHIYFCHHDWLPHSFQNQPADYLLLIQEYYDEIHEVLTEKQREILDYILTSKVAKDADLWKHFGYSSEAGFRQIVKRLRRKIEEILYRE